MMSMTRCDKCEKIFDTDIDCDGMQDGKTICERCYYND